MLTRAAIGFATTVLVLLGWGGNLHAQDSVRRISGPALTGDIVEMSATEVKVNRGADLIEAAPVNEIDHIQFKGEPTLLKQARTQVAEGNYENALEVLEKIGLDTISRAEVKTDIQFYKAQAAARLAVAGLGDVTEAGKQMVAFIKDHPKNYHALAADESVGDLLMAAGKHDAARKYYDNVAAAPWPDYKMRAGVAIGQSFLAQEKYTEAQQAFDAVLAAGSDAKTDAAKLQVHAAQLGKASCLAQSQDVPAGLKLVDEVIAQVDANEVDLMGRAYLTQGNCLRLLPDKKNEAVQAFLRVDLMYNTNPQIHAEALARLATLWNELGKPDRGLSAAQTLKDRYAGSSWAK